MIGVLNVIKRIFILNLVAFILFCFLLDDEEYLETSTTESATTEASSSDSAKDTITQPVDLSEFFDTNIIREKQVQLKGDGQDTVTVLMYINGSNLETNDGEATTDISEMISAGTSDKVNCLIQTMGTKKWKKKYGIASDHSQRFKVVEGGLELVDDSLGQLDCTDPKTLTNFIKWGAKNYPADRYILMFWDHGAGPVYGFGYDEWQDEDASMSIAEMRSALKDAGVFFDFIGMDCCIMSCIETTVALYDFCDYTLLSEEYESGLGWSYKGWLSALNENSSIDTISLGKIAIDDNIADNENDFIDGDSACMSLIDESMMKILYKAWLDFAYANEKTLLGKNYSQKIKKSKRTHPLLFRKNLSDYLNTDILSNFGIDVSLSDYYITDIMSVAQNIDSDETAALSAAVNSAIAYNKTTSDSTSLTGLSVTLPYGDSEFYDTLRDVFSACGIDSDYIEWLEKFTTAEGQNQYYDYKKDWDSWDGWDSYEDDYDWSDWNTGDDQDDDYDSDCVYNGNCDNDYSYDYDEYYGYDDDDYDYEDDYDWYDFDWDDGGNYLGSYYWNNY